MYNLSFEITIPLIILVGLVAAIVASLMGLGGGVITIPLIMLVIGVDKNLEAKLITYVSIFVLSFFALLKYFLQKQKPVWLKMTLITLGIIPSTVVSELYLGKILSQYEIYFHIAYAVFIAFLIIVINFKEFMKRGVVPLWSLPLFGLIFGLLSGGIGIFGGIFAFLILGLSMNLKQAVINAIYLQMFASLANIIIGIASGQYAAFESHGVPWFLPFIIIVGSVPGSLIGPMISKNINNSQTRLIFNIVMGILLVWEICLPIVISLGFL